jgi:hypothetical protein
VCQGVELVDDFWGVLMDCTFLTYFDFRGSRIGRKLSVPWEGMIETNLSIQRDSRVGRRLSVSLSVATLSPFLILLSSPSPWGGKPSLVICRLPVFFNGAIFVGIVSTEWEQRTVSICLISSLFLIAVLSQFFSVRRLACVTFVVFLVYVLSSLGLSLPSGLCLRSSLLVSLTGVTFG